MTPLNLLTRLWLRCTALALVVLLVGCATGPTANPKDPFEPFNRGITSFNDGLDKVVLKPVATAYVAVTPTVMRAGVTNFFSNLSDAWTFVNSVLQLRPQKALETLMRFNVNTFFGLGGLLDIASEMNIPKHNEDLGKTLGRWGVPSGPYVVLPLFGPSTVRDSLTILTEASYDPVSRITPARDRFATTGLRVVNTRANFLRLGNLLDDAALDKYSFTRDAFLAKRNADVARSANKPDNDDADKDADKDAEKDNSKDSSKDKEPAVTKPVSSLDDAAVPTASVAVPDASLQPTATVHIEAASTTTAEPVKTQ
jgi:phospholipid-binding lipoprotein MlaA